MAGPFWPDDGLPTLRTWCPPADCPVCARASKRLELHTRRDDRLTGYWWSGCRHKVYVCRFCGWPSGVAYGLGYHAPPPAIQCTCRLHFRPLTAALDAEFEAIRRTAVELLPVDLDALTAL